MLQEYAYFWLHNKWLCWGVGPFIAANIGFFLPALILEYHIGKTRGEDLLTYGNKAGDQNRKDLLKNTQVKASFSLQFRYCLWTLLGPTAIFNAFLNALISDFIYPVSDTTPLVPNILEFIVQLLFLLYIGDFGLYWGHRIQHMNEFLWKKCHSLHHTIDTPSPVSTLYIDSTDATLQGGLPILLAAWIVRPHPFVMCIYVALRLADNAINHSGLGISFSSNHTKGQRLRTFLNNTTGSVILDVFSLRFLPFRSSVAHHDAHHKYSNYARNAKNYGEFFWIWDKLFGTLNNRKMA